MRGPNLPTRPHPRERPKLLFLCQTLPYPPDGGVSNRTYNVMRLLARAFDVVAMCFYRRATRPGPVAVEAGLRGLGAIADVEAFPIPQERHALRFAWDHARSIARRRVYTRYAYESDAFAGALVERLGRGGFALVHMDSLDLSGYLPILAGIPVICTHHNVESDLLRRRARTESLLRGAYLRLQARWMELDERRWCGRVALNLAVSRQDADRLESLAPNSEVAVVPNGVDTHYFRPQSNGTRGLVFVGGHAWYPNRDAMGYFAEEILPRIRARHSDVLMTWVGRAPPEAEKRFAALGVRLTGYVDDIRPYVGEAACYVVPLRVGGGTRLKILDAWAMGKAVVSTTVGCEGLDARDGVNILVRDEPEAFADAVARVLGDVALRQRLGEHARRTAEELYDWDVIGRALIERYRNVAGLSDPRPSFPAS